MKNKNGYNLKKKWLWKAPNTHCKLEANQMQNAWLFSVNMLVYFIFVSLCPFVHLPISFFYKLNVLENLPARLG